MSFPNTLDTTTTIPVESASTPLATSHVTAHTAIQTAIIAIETLLGVTASAVAGTFNYILGEITGSDKAVGKTATQQIDNKTLGTGTKIALGSDATGDIYYNGGSGVVARLPAVNGKIIKFVGGVPTTVDEAVTVNASTTVAGIGEVATSAEITAGTATGGTGAPLVVTPDQLAGSTPTFSGLGLTNTVRLIRLAGYSPAANTTENTVYTTTIPANVLGANGMIRVRTPVAFSVSATAETWTIRLKYGGTTLLSFTVSSNALGGGNAVNSYGFIESLIINNAATNAQNVGMYASIAPQVGANTNPVTPVAGNGGDTTATIDTTSSQTLTMTVQRTNGGGGGATFYQSIVEVIRNA